MRRVLRTLSHRLRQIAVAVLSSSLAVCGGSPQSPTPQASASPSRTPGGDLVGAYSLVVEPAARCGFAAGSLTFTLQATPSSGEVQAVYLNVASPDPSALELELLQRGNDVRGGAGTRDDGVMAQENLRAWIRAIGAGSLARLGTGPGEITEGTLTGYIALADAAGPEGELGSCLGADHRFTLRTTR